MKSIFHTYKILISMLLLIIFIQLSTLVYVWKFGTDILLEKETKELAYQLDIDAKLLLSKMNNLQKELKFLSTLEVMDDILVKDIDKRITVLLYKTSQNLGNGIILEVANRDIILASVKEAYHLKDFFIFRVPLYASFNRKKKIGSLSLLYPLKNLMNLKKDNPHQKLWLIPPFKKYHLSLHVLNESIVTYRVLNDILKEWKLYLSYEKEYALKSIKEIEKMLFIAFLLSLFLLLFTVWILSKKQITILENTKELLELKRIFFSTMSHELRTPLASILNLTQNLMVSPHLRDVEVDTLVRIENASEHLLSMINNLLQLSKLESKTIIIKKEKIDMSVIIEEMIEIVEPLMDEKGLALTKKIVLQKRDILTDVHLFKQIVMNLLSNAIKFTKKGEIAIFLLQKGDSFVFKVIDTGIGIEKEKQKSIFTEFYQAHTKEIKHSTGLGLALSQKMATLIASKIELSSEGLGLGTTVVFTFKSI